MVCVIKGRIMGLFGKSRDEDLKPLLVPGQQDSSSEKEKSGGYSKVTGRYDGDSSSSSSSSDNPYAFIKQPSRLSQVGEKIKQVRKSCNIL